MVVDQRRGLGPGSIRVGRFVGRLGVVGMPAVEYGLVLAGRVIRRHVARLEEIGWLERRTAIRGEGSFIWLTSQGLSGVELGQLAAVRAPAVLSAKTMHSIQVAWVAAELEHGGLGWLGVRELALDSDRWQVEIANERGGISVRLPDLVTWPVEGQRPAAIVLERSQPHHHQRQRALLAGWRQAIADGRYAQVRYQTAPQVAHRLRRLAAEIGLAAPEFICAERVRAAELAPAAPAAEQAITTAPPPAAISAPPPAPDDEPDPPPPPQPADEPASRPQRTIDEILHELLGGPDNPAAAGAPSRHP